MVTTYPGLRAVRHLIVALILYANLPVDVSAADESDYYRLETIAQSQSPTTSRSPKWRPSTGIVLEATGLATLPDGRLAVATRKGDVWLLDGVYDNSPAAITYHRFAKGLHEPLGLAFHRGSLFVAQRSELTQLLDTDGDDVADQYLATGKGWGVTGNYHEYTYGPVIDQDGSFWLTLNIGMGDRLNDNDLWRGWAVKVTARGELIPVCGGMRSPCGVGANSAGDLFFSDQQGNWVGTGSIHHLRPGAFYGHPDALKSADSPGSTLKDVGHVPSGLPWPQAIDEIPKLKPPAVWLPYKKMGQSATDIVCDTTEGRFGPFTGQLFIGEFRLATINRVYLEKVNGEYQGACFPFRQGFSCGVVRMTFGSDGSLFAGLTNRGWSSIGTASYGLQRLVWTGKMPFEIKEMRATPDGFALHMTAPVDIESATSVESYTMTSYSYLLHKQYGSDEIDRRQLTVQQATVSPDGMRVQLRIAGCRKGYVHELQCDGVRSRAGQPLLHADAYYTLNQIPR